MKIDEELMKILEDNDSEEWQNRCIRLLAIATLDVRKTLYWIKWILSTIIVLLVLNILR